jgi:hypothetical protein
MRRNILTLTKKRSKRKEGGGNFFLKRKDEGKTRGRELVLKGGHESLISRKVKMDKSLS